jgi:hypothetical protein
MMNAGRYKARGVEAKIGKSGTGKIQVAVLLETTEERERITWYGYFSSEQATDIALRTLALLGWGCQSLDDLSGINQNEVVIKVDHEEYNGKTSAKVKSVYPIGGGISGESADAAEVRALNASLKGKMAELAAKRPKVVSDDF